MRYEFVVGPNGMEWREKIDFKSRKIFRRWGLASVVAKSDRKFVNWPLKKKRR